MTTSSKASIAIEHEEEDGRGAFFVERQGIRLAEMTYSRTGEHLIIVDHTQVDEQLRGLGVARLLLDTLVAWARQTKTRVAATCPYAKAQFEKDGSIQDVYER
ncbi:MAG: GNAT family N-acetyltransferase [Myxococcales bacterium]